MTWVEYIKSELAKATLPSVDRYLVFSKDMWKLYRSANIPIAQWTDEEIEKADKVTGFLGRKMGVACYILVPLLYKVK